LVKVTYNLEMDNGDGMGDQMRVLNNWSRSRTGWRWMKEMLDNQIWVFKQLTTSTYKLETDEGDEDEMRDLKQLVKFTLQPGDG